MKKIAKIWILWRVNERKIGNLTEKRGILGHIFSKNILTKLKQYARMVVTSDDRDAKVDFL